MAPGRPRARVPTSARSVGSAWEPLQQLAWCHRKRARRRRALTPLPPPPPPPPTPPPRPAGSTLFIYDAPKKPFAETHPGAAPPFPVYTLTDTDRAHADGWASGAFLSPEEELLLDAAALGAGPTPERGAPLAKQRLGHLVSNASPITEAVIKAARVAGVALDPETSAVPPATLAALAAKPRPPPCEWIMKPPAVDPFSIPENDEAEES